jgi:hypothetical protein
MGLRPCRPSVLRVLVNDNKSDNRPNHTRGGNRSVAEPIKDLAFLILENSPTRKTFFKNRKAKT